MLRATQIIAKTDTGRQRRDNEDSAYARPPVFVVADGMGGAQAGEVASRMAVETFQSELPVEGSPEERLVGCARAANHSIYEVSRRQPELAGMGTTLTAVYVGDHELSIAHVGDSRAYLFRDAELQRLTQDHSLVGELMRRGKLTEEQAAEHPQRSIITRALGIDPEVEIDTWTYRARAGDVILLCSDGLTSMIGERQIATALRQQSDLDRAGERLIAEANEAGGRDNITVVLFTLEEVDGDRPGDQPTVVGLQAPAARLADGASPPRGDGPGSSGAGASARSPGATITAPERAQRPNGVQAPPSSPSPPPPTSPSSASPSPRTGAPLARTQGRSPARAARAGRRRGLRRSRGLGRLGKATAALLAVVVVAVLIGGGGYLATRQLFFVGTNPQGIVTIYNGLPYELPLGVRLYEQVYASGVPIQLVPAARRAQLLNHQLRSQADAISLVHAVELGQLSP